ncbi:MAG: T9SS type A sorting domain-containing protein, partial [Flavobacterium sp.]|nr:T9SS type A sorting domain-containing protein [Flavobacterium sp.]
SDFDKTSVRLYPNPTQGTVTFEAAENIKKTTFYNALGQIITVQTSNTADLSAFGNGIYTARIEFENGRTTTQKIIKK